MNESQDNKKNPRTNLIAFVSLLFSRMAEKYGGGTTLNELALLNYGFVCHARGDDICVTQASIELGMPKSTVSRILTGMRSSGFVTEEVDPSDRRRRIFRLAVEYLNHTDDDIQKFLDWCAQPENRLC